MIDPTQITNYNRTEAELEEFLMFAILVAGKTAKTQAEKLEAFLKPYTRVGTSPFEGLQHLIEIGSLVTYMKAHKLGQYKRIETAFRQILTFKGDLKKVSVQDLESVKGIGPKTARFFILHSRPNAQIACLDVHILKWLAKETRIGMPKATPSGKKYAEIEQLFLTEASIRGMPPADLDLQIWKSFSQKTLA
jgi:thermostable 8-oxoguanine DNA glycosylase